MTEAQTEKDLPALGVLGGTFDPIHYGHLIIAQSLVEELNLAQMLFLLSAHPPHKKTSAIAPWQDRLQMMKLALQGNPHFQTSDVELKQHGPSYTVETMKLLQSRYAQRYRVLFIVGADSILEIFTWREPERLLDSRSLVVVPRPGCDLRKLDPRVAEKVTVVHAPLIEISSSDIRQRISQGRSIQYLTPEEVTRYIRGHNLYGQA
jgi:nicotinate-nucleotide adenylyltransferase